MTIVELGELKYVEVDSHEIDKDILLNEMSIDELWEAIEEEGTYVTASYGVQVCTPERDEYIDFEEEVFIETEDCVRELQDRYNQLDNLRSNTLTKLREAQDRKNETGYRPTRLRRI